MDQPPLKSAIENGRIQWQRHALERMLERGISRDIVKRILMDGEIIANYPDDQPFPSALFLGWLDEMPYHVVASFDVSRQCCFVITAYKPNLDVFEPDFKTRRKL
jgi:hypothetical protein